MAFSYYKAIPSRKVFRIILIVFVLFFISEIIVYLFVTSDTSKKPNTEYVPHRYTSLHSYAVYGVSLPDLEQTIYQDSGWQYLYYLPITAHAWWRLNVSSIIIIAGEDVSDKVWDKHHKLKEIYDLIKSIPYIRFVYLPCSQNRKTMVSQTARIFASSFVPFIPDNTYLITTEADLVPLSDLPYRTLGISSVLLYNAFCCGYFNYKDTQYRMFPLSNIAATVNYWKLLTRKYIVTSADDIIKVLSTYYPLPDKLQEGIIDDRYMGQHVVSILLAEATFNKTLVSRSLTTRIDRSSTSAWNIDEIAENMVDAHMPLPGWDNAHKVKKLVHALFDEEGLVEILERYIDNFVKDKSDTSGRTWESLAWFLPYY